MTEESAILTSEHHLFAELLDLAELMASVARADTAYSEGEWRAGKRASPLAAHSREVAYVVQKRYGGVVLEGYVKTERGRVRHAFNRVGDGTVVDLAGVALGGDGVTPVAAYGSLINVEGRGRARIFWQRVHEAMDAENFEPPFTEKVEVVSLSG